MAGTSPTVIRSTKRPKQSRGEMFSYDLLLNAVTAGLLLGGFYAAVTVGVSISFGILDIVNIAHPAFIILGSYIAYFFSARFGLDPILTSIIALPAFYALGAVIYQVYYLSFEKRGQESLRGLAFFFGILFITEVCADPRVRGRLPLRPGELHRDELAHRRGRPAAAHAGAVPDVARDAGGPAAVPDADLHRPRHHGGVAGPACAAVDGAPIRSGSSASPSRSRSRPPRWPARS